MSTMPSAEARNTQSLGDQVRRAIVQLGYTEHGAIKCEFDGATVTLTGELSSFYLTQIAQTIAMRVPGVRRVNNEIQVRPEGGLEQA